MSFGPYISSNVRVVSRDAEGRVIQDVRRHNTLQNQFFLHWVRRLADDTYARVHRLSYYGDGLIIGSSTLSSGWDESYSGEIATVDFDSTTVTNTTGGAVLSLVHTLTNADITSDTLKYLSLDTATTGTSSNVNLGLVTITDDPIEKLDGGSVEVTWQIRLTENRVDGEWALTRLFEDDANDHIGQITVNATTGSVTLTNLGTMLRVAPSSSVSPSAGTGISLETAGGATVWEDADVDVPSGTYDSSELAIFLFPQESAATLFVRDTFNEAVPTDIADHTPDEVYSDGTWGGASWSGDLVAYENRLLGDEGKTATLSMYDGTASAYRIVFKWFIGKGDAPNERGTLIGTPEISDATLSSGDTAVDIQTLGSEEVNILEGDLIQFAANTSVYEATADLTLGTSSSGTLNITPGLVSGDVPSNGDEIKIVGHSATAALDDLHVEVYEEDGGNDLARVTLQAGVDAKMQIETSTDGGTSWTTQVEVAIRTLIYERANTVEISIAADRLVWATLNRQTLVYDLGTGTSWKPRFKVADMDPNEFISDLDIYLTA